MSRSPSDDQAAREEAAREWQMGMHPSPSDPDHPEPDPTDVIEGSDE